MKTKLQLIHDTVNTLTLEHIAKDLEKQTGYGDRFMKAAKIVLAGGVKDLGHGEYEVHSGTEADIRYKVNGTCNCQDWKNWLKHEAWLKKPEGDDVKTFAPKGYCKHRIAAKFYAHTLAHLKNLVERFSLPHPHRWTCETHKHLPVECWEAVCPDPTDIACPTCQREANVPAYVEEIIADDGAPTEDYTINPETGEEGEEPPMMTTIGETIKSVVTSLNGHANGTSPTEDPHTQATHAFATHEATLATPLPLRTTEYEEAPVLTPKPLPMPEAPVSFYIKFKVENFELSYTMRALTDGEVIARLPGVLAGLEDVLKIEIDHDEPFLKRLLHAFFPKPSRYTGK